MMVGPETADAAGRRADNRAGLTVPRAFAIRTRCDIDCIFQRRRDGAIMLGRDKKNGIRCPDPLSERSPLRRWSLIAIWVVDRQLRYLNNAQLQRCGCESGNCVCNLAVERFLTEAADDDSHVPRFAHAALSLERAAPP
jgi:hypothetical protein